MLKQLQNFFCCIFLFITLPVYADQLIIEPEMGRAPLLKLINQSEHSLKIVMYGLTDNILLNAIVQKKLQNKTVNIILEATPYKAQNENQKAIAILKKQNVKWKGMLPGISFIHQKTFLIDGKKVLVMTFNLTRSAFKNDRNFGLIIDDPKRVRAIDDLFTADWNGKEVNLTSSDLIVSPQNSREKLIALITRSKHSIQIYAQSLSDYKITGALAKAARNGVKVEMLTSAKLKEKQAAFLAKAGVKVRESKQYYIHAKVFIFDNNKAVIGSINLTKGSLDNNRELAVITYDSKVISKLKRTFQQDWSNAETNLLKNFLTDKKTILRTIKKIEKYTTRQ